jgi:hypothetical protein
MFCGECGTENPDTNQFCKNCGKPLKKKPQQPDTVPAPAVATITPPHHMPPAPVPAIPKKPGNSKKFIIIGAVIIVVILAAIFLIMQPGSPINGLTAPGAKASEVVHGTISTGPVVEAASVRISANGGIITVNKPGSAIDGLKFSAPAGAYPSGQQVTISSAPITGNTFGSNFNPATPMIEINAGQGYADEPILVTIPVNIPDNQFAMAFYYDDATKKLEGIPTDGQDSKSITIATRHFSNILVSMISLSSLNGITKVDSGFRPGVDDWEFVNGGSYIAPGGYCAGQSATMMWYYTEQRQKNPASPGLYGLYDNNGREKTPLFPADNTRGIRFASVLQKVTDQQKYWDNSDFLSNISDSTTFREFKYSILMTGEPQYISIRRDGGGHAIVCYEVSDSTLWIADPNFPGKERMITLNGTTLSPYTSGANSQDIKENGVRIYPRIRYAAKSALFSWPTLSAEYAKVKDGTIGDDQFSPYATVIYAINDDGSLKEAGRIAAGGKNTGVTRINVGTKTVQINVVSPATGATVSYQDGRTVKNPITLSEGSNLIAVEGVRRDVNQEWYGFDWIDLVYNPPVTTPPVATRTLTKARDYTAASTWRSDPDCHMENPYADTNCVPVTTQGARMRILPYCGSPPDKCINRQVNNGIEGEFTYYTKTEGGLLIPVIDGWWLHYSSLGMDSKEKFRDGSQVGFCSRYSTGWECNGDTS